MPVSLVLVAGGGVTGCIAAIAFARRGVEVTLVGPAAGSVDEGRGLADSGSATRALEAIAIGPVDAGGGDIRSALVGIARDLGVDVRLDAELVGFAHVDTYVEAELSHGRVADRDSGRGDSGVGIENYDAVVAVGDRSFRDGRVIAIGDGPPVRSSSSATGVARGPEDAVLLAELLTRGGDIEALLQEYDRERGVPAAARPTPPRA